MRAAIDIEDGALVIEGGGRVGRSASPADALAALNGQGEIGQEGARTVVRAEGEVGGRAFRIALRFRGDELDQARLEGVDSPEGEPEALRVERDRVFLRALFGPAGYENAAGTLRAFAWGFLYSKNGAILLVPKRHPAPVPLPGKGRSEGETFRCCSCGHVMDLGYGRGVLTANLDRGGAPCEACGAVAWVQVGSTTEFYRYSQRPWVCEVGMHPADNVKLFRLKSAAGPPAAGKLAIAEVLIKACPAHVDALRRGFLGCVLPDGAQGEDPK